MLPRIVLHNAVSLDGRMDWLTPDLGLYYGLVSRWQEQATLVGSETILASIQAEVPPDDEPSTLPGKAAENDPRPLLVVVDSRGRVRHWASLRKAPYWRGGVALCSNATPGEHLEYLRSVGVDYLVAGEEHVDLRRALEALNELYRVQVVRVDSGGLLNGVLLRQGLVHEVSVLLEPCLVGGLSPRSLFRAPDLDSLEGVLPLRLMEMERIGDRVWLRYELER